jgi:hypothetical protein
MPIRTAPKSGRFRTCDFMIFLSGYFQARLTFWSRIEQSTRGESHGQRSVRHASVNETEESDPSVSFEAGGGGRESNLIDAVLSRARVSGTPIRYSGFLY